MHRASSVLLSFVLFSAGAPTSAATPPPAPQAPTTAPTTAPPTAAQAPAPSATSPKAPVAAPDLLAGRTLKEICDDTGLLLSRYDFDDLHKDGGFQKTCCVAGGLDDDGVCALDWPFSDVPSCSAYDELRNHIFARYGFPFTKDQWKKRFASEPWYVPRADFNERWLTPAAQRNVKRLLQLKANHQACSPD